MLAQFIKPDLAVNIIRKQCEKQLKTEIKEFQIFFDVAKDTIYFIIHDEKYIFPSDSLKSVIKMQLKSKDIKFDCNYVQINVSGENKLEAIIFFEKDGKKQFEKYNLN